MTLYLELIIETDTRQFLQYKKLSKVRIEDTIPNKNF